MRSLVFLFLLATLMPAFVAAQECTEDDAFELEFCLEDSKFACLDAFPQCEDPGSGLEDISTSIVNNISESCCNKGTSSKIQLCFSSVMAGLKRSGKVILPGGIASEVRNQIRTLMSEVKENGECFSDEEEEDDGDEDFEDEF